jgi:hypothetical protein
MLSESAPLLLPVAHDALTARIIEVAGYPAYQPTDALFPGRAAGSKSKHTLGAQISKVVFKFIGLHVNVHMFRHAGGKIHLDERPGEYETIAKSWVTGRLPQRRASIPGQKNRPRVGTSSASSSSGAIARRSDR